MIKEAIAFNVDVKQTKTGVDIKFKDQDGAMIAHLTFAEARDFWQAVERFTRGKT